MTLIAVAFGGGVVLGRMATGRKPSRLMSSKMSELSPTVQHAAPDRQTQQVLDTWDHISGASLVSRLRDSRVSSGRWSLDFKSNSTKSHAESLKVSYNMPLSRIPRLPGPPGSIRSAHINGELTCQRLTTRPIK